MSDVDSMPIDPSNLDQQRAWDGHEGAYWTANADRFDRTMHEYHLHLLDRAAIGTSDRVLDIGCGTGQLTRDAARAASGGTAFGVDLSSAMVEYARQRAASDGVHNAEFARADAQVHAFDAGAFDLALSRMGAMFFGDPAAAFANVAAALRTDGRLVFVTWQGLPHNEWMGAIRAALAVGRDLPTPPPDAPGPFALSDPNRIRSLLDVSGYADVTVEASEAAMWFGADATEACTFVLGLLGWLLDDLDDDGRVRALEALHAAMAAREGADGVRLGSAAWVVCARRR